MAEIIEALDLFLTSEYRDELWELRPSSRGASVTVTVDALFTEDQSVSATAGVHLECS